MNKKELEQNYNTLFNELVKMREEKEFKFQFIPVKEDSRLNDLKKDIGSYDLKKDIPSYTSSDKKAESHLDNAKLHLDNAKHYIRSGEGILSKNMKEGEGTYEVALTEIKDAEKELKNYKNPEEVKGVKKEMANFAEALSRKIKIDIEKKNNEYALKKGLDEKDVKEIVNYEKYRDDALRVAEEAIKYADGLKKECEEPALVGPRYIGVHKKD